MLKQCLQDNEGATYHQCLQEQVLPSILSKTLLSPDDNILKIIIIIVMSVLKSRKKVEKNFTDFILETAYNNAFNASIPGPPQHGPHVGSMILLAIVHPFEHAICNNHRDFVDRSNGKMQ